MPVQLRCRDLRPGDVLLEVSDGSRIAHPSETDDGAAALPDAPLIGAGILSDSVRLIEAQGDNITAGDLRIRYLRGSYLVFRCMNAELATGAAACADGMARGLAGSPSIQDLRERVRTARNQRFFCARLIVYAYQFVAAQREMPIPTFFTDADASVAPSFLAGALTRNPLFRQVGYVLAGQR
jgi:hypothetical protein